MTFFNYHITHRLKSCYYHYYHLQPLNIPVCTHNIPLYVGIYYSITKVPKPIAISVSERFASHDNHDSILDSCLTKVYIRIARRALSGDRYKGPTGQQTWKITIENYRTQLYKVLLINVYHDIFQLTCNCIVDSTSMKCDFKRRSFVCF